MKWGVATGHFSLVQPSGAHSIALAEGATPASALLGYVSSAGAFYTAQGPGAAWTKQASNVTAIGVAVLGPSSTPLLGYLSNNVFYAGEGVLPSSWVELASGAAQIAVAAGPAAGALPVLGYVTTTGEFEVEQGPLQGTFSVQARGVSSVALSSLTNFLKWNGPAKGATRKTCLITP